jgi:hypothetical protein
MENWGGSGNVLENKASYALKAVMLLKIQEIGCGTVAG